MATVQRSPETPQQGRDLTFDPSRPMPVIEYLEDENCELEPVYDTNNLSEWFTAALRVSGRAIQDSEPTFYDLAAVSPEALATVDALERLDPGLFQTAIEAVEEEQARLAARNAVRADSAGLFVSSEEAHELARTPQQERAWKILFSGLYSRLGPAIAEAGAPFTPEDLCQ